MAQIKRSGVYLRVLYDYDYQGHDGQPVSIKAFEECLLLKKTTPEWWYVIKQGQKKPIYVPANYMEEIHKTVIRVDDDSGSSGKIRVEKQAPVTAPKPSRAAPVIPSRQTQQASAKKKGPPPKPPAKPVVRKASDEDEVLKQLDNILEHAFDHLPSVDENEASGNSATNSKSNSLQRGEELLVLDSNPTGSSPVSSGSNSRTGSLQRGEKTDIDSKQYNSNNSNQHSNISHSKTNSDTSGLDEPVPDYEDDEDEGNHSHASPSTGRHGDNSSPNIHRELMGDSGISEGSNEYLDKMVPIGDTGSGENSLGRKSPEQPNYENIGNVHRISALSNYDADDEPDYANIGEIHASINAEPPPVGPPAEATPDEITTEGWHKYRDSTTNRPYYYNPDTLASTWIPPSESSSQSSGGPKSASNRNSAISTSSKELDEDPFPPAALTPIPSPSPAITPIAVTPTTPTDNKEESDIHLPMGWSTQRGDSGEVLFKNTANNTMWKATTNTSGKTYFFNEESGKALWELPEVLPPSRTSADVDIKVVSPSDDELQDKLEKLEKKFTNPKQYLRKMSAPDFSEYSTLIRQKKQNNSLKVEQLQEKQGKLQVTKVLENGKKTKKNWNNLYVHVKGGTVFIYKDQKQATSKANFPNGKPENQFDLPGASVEYSTKDITSKKNAIQVTTKNEDTQFLFQFDDTNKMHEWYAVFAQNIEQVSNPLGLSQPDLSAAGVDSHERTSGGKLTPENTLTKPGSGKNKPSSKSGSLERATTPTTPDDPEKAKNVRHFLYKWLYSRPTMESLRKKGIYKDAVFGAHLHRICDHDGCNIPHLVTLAVTAIEKRGLGTDGIYRISGNMAQIQKLRLQVDSGSQCDLDSAEWEIHVLTGTLKLFFREMTEPLIPFTFYDKFVLASQSSKEAKIKVFRDLIKTLPPSNRETLKVLSQHLHRVTEHSSQNRMQVQNLAIVWGPTLMKPQEAGDVAMAMVQSGQVIEYILQHCQKLFN